MLHEFVPPSEEETRVVEELQRELRANKELSHDFGFTKTLRFYWGRKGDKDKAYRAMVRHDAWRRDLKVDSILERQFSEGNYAKVKAGPNYRLLNGQPAVYIIARKHNKNNRDVEELRDFIIYSLEEALKAADPREERLNMVFDLHEFSLSCMDYEGVQMIIQILGHNYPETLQRAYIVNHPVLFSACWFVISPWLDETTRAKVVFTSPEELRQLVDPASAPHEVFGLRRPAE